MIKHPQARNSMIPIKLREINFKGENIIDINNQTTNQVRQISRLQMNKFILFLTLIFMTSTGNSVDTNSPISTKSLLSPLINTTQPLTSTTQTIAPASLGTTEDVAVEREDMIMDLGDKATSGVELHSEVDNIMTLIFPILSLKDISPREEQVYRDKLCALLKLEKEISMSLQFDWYLLLLEFDDQLRFFHREKDFYLLKRAFISEIEHAEADRIRDKGLPNWDYEPVDIVQYIIRPYSSPSVYDRSMRISYHRRIIWTKGRIYAKLSSVRVERYLLSLQRGGRNKRELEFLQFQKNTHKMDLGLLEIVNLLSTFADDRNITDRGRKRREHLIEPFNLRI